MSEGPYVEGEKHGDWVWRNSRGRLVNETYVNGRQVS